MAENVVSVEKNCEKSNRDIQALIEFVKGETVEINEKVQEITKRINRD
jgi:glycine cleavage system H lipoate-binding protein